MGHTNSTANLALPQFIGTDKPTWLSDVNGAFAAIDSYAGSNDAALAITDGKADTAIADASNAVTTAGNAATTAGNAAATATAANTVAGNALTVANGINAKVGVLTNLTTTDKSTVVNAINEVNGKDAGDIAYDNTGSGLTATNVQAAIDEVAQGGGGGITRTVLWSNPDPTQTFTSGPITVANLNDGYDEIIFQALTKKDVSGFVEVKSTYSLITGATNKAITFSGIGGSTYDRMAGRTLTVVDATNITVGSGYYNASTDNDFYIPYQIIGIKY